MASKLGDFYESATYYYEAMIVAKDGGDSRCESFALACFEIARAADKISVTTVSGWSTATLLVKGEIIYMRGRSAAQVALTLATKYVLPRLQIQEVGGE
jgi:hypothetical protein